MIVMTYRELTAWVLVVLFCAATIFMYIFNPAAENQNAVVEEPTETTPTNSDPTQQPTQTESSSCTDDKKNQDETDIDCGGSCKACAVGNKCSTNNDCSTNDCSSGSCAATAQLSGKIDLTVNDVGYEKSGKSARVTDVKITLSNGESSPLEAEIRLYAKSYSDIFYLNQLDSGKPDENKPYATIKLPTIASGKSLTQSFDVSASLLGNWQDPDQTDILEEGFSVELILVDGSGNILKTVKKAVRV